MLANPQKIFFAMKPNLSLSALRESVEATSRRFPAACAFAILLAVYLIYAIYAEKGNGVIIYYLSVGCLMSLMLSLWQENADRDHHFWTINIAAHALLLADAYVLEFHTTNYSAALFAAHTAAVFALVLGTIFLPFRRAKDDVPAWAFTITLITHAALALIIGGVMAGGTCALLAGFDALFDVNVNSKLYSCLMVVFMVLLPILMFLSRVPRPQDIRVDKVRLSGFLMGTVRYLFIPLVAGYMVVLYAYLVKILVTWTLPQGAVSWLVTVMMVGILAVIFMLYPAIHNGELKTFESKIVRWAPLAALPLVVLMTVGIVRRFSDYGITANRLYVITVNLWFYLVCIGLFLIRSRRIHWVFLSFGAILLLTSAQPMNYYEISRRSISHDIEEAMAKYPAKHLPFDREDEVRAWVKSMPKEKRETAYSKLAYLRNNYAEEDYNRWVKDDVYLWSYHEFEDVDSVEVDYTIVYDKRYEPLPVLEGHKYFRHCRHDDNSNTKNELMLNDSICRLHIPDVISEDESKELTVKINIKEIERLKDDKNHVFRYKAEDGSAEIILSFLCINFSPGLADVHIEYEEFK